jgi:hypothetical protein
MKECVICGEKLEDDAKFCSKCGGKQTPEKSVPKKPSGKKPSDMEQLTLRQYFREAAKWDALTEKRKEIFYTFLGNKGVDKSQFPKAEKILCEIMAIYALYNKEKESDKPLKKLQTTVKKMKAKTGELLDDFETVVKKKAEGKQKFNTFNDKKAEIYTRLKEVSENDGSCDDKECGCNNCYQFAMKVAAGKDDINDCPFIDEDF